MSAGSESSFKPRVIRWSDRSAEVAWNDDGSRVPADVEPDHMISLYHDGALCVTTGDKVIHIAMDGGKWSVQNAGKELVLR